MGRKNRWNIFTRAREIERPDVTPGNLNHTIVDEQTRLAISSSIKDMIKGLKGTVIVGDVDINMTIKMGDRIENNKDCLIATNDADIRIGKITGSFNKARTELRKRGVPNQAEVEQHLNALEELLKAEKKSPEFDNVWGWIKSNASWIVPTLETVVMEALKIWYGLP
jgi:hypothetical protein